MTGLPLSQEEIGRHNARHRQTLDEDYDHLARQLSRSGTDIDRLTKTVGAFDLALPSWGVGRGGTRFARFPIAGEPTNLREKLEDCAVVNQLSRMTPRVSLHFPWDHVSDYDGLREEAAALGLGFDAVNSNSFQDQANQRRSYAAGSLTATDAEVRDQAVALNVDCIEIGRKLGSRALTLWIGDGSNLPGQQHLGRALDRYVESARKICDALPGDWTLLIEHKLYEPAFYSTVISDWGTSLQVSQLLGDKAKCLIDLGHHAPSVNIEQIVARVHAFGKLGGFHFNDSKYGDDDLDSGSINPHQLFLIFNELAEAAGDGTAFAPAYMIDQSHNVTDPIESLLSSSEAIATAFAKAALVDRDALHEAQDRNDAMLAFQTLRRAYRTDVTPVLAKARLEAGGAIDMIGCYREAGWRNRKAQERKAANAGTGIV